MKPPINPPGAKPRAPNPAPIAPDLAIPGNCFFKNLDKLGGSFPPLNSPYSSSVPNNHLEKDEEFFTKDIPDPKINPPNKPIGEPVAAAPTKAPMEPPAKVSGRYGLIIPNTSFTVFLVSSTAPSPNNTSALCLADLPNLVK